MNINIIIRCSNRNSLIDSNIMEILNEEDILIVKHIGGDNDSIDFICNNNKSLSLKTLKKNDGKICPQKGQPTYKSFHKYIEKNISIPGKGKSESLNAAIATGIILYELARQ